MALVLVILLCTLCGLIVTPFLGLWLVLQIRQAAQYRKIQRILLEIQRSGPADPNQWTIVHRVGKELTETKVSASSEGEALREAIKAGVAHNKIQEIRRG